MQKFPEIVAPVGSWDKLPTAVFYGAHAVYVSGKSFGLRAGSANFNQMELSQAVKFAHGKNVRFYVVLNAFLHDKDMTGIDEYIRALEEIGVDAVVVSDPGVLRKVKENSQLKIHLSTQTSCLNSGALSWWERMGVSRVVLGREVNIEDAMELAKKGGTEIEVFIHGARCMAYSGHCFLSNMVSMRDSNRGGCKHNCRFFYDVEMRNRLNKLSLLSSRDLCTVRLFPKLFNSCLSGLKIEGRMKGHFYLARVLKTYTSLSDKIKKGCCEEGDLLQAEKDLALTTTREFTGGFLAKDLEDNMNDESIKTNPEGPMLGRTLTASAYTQTVLEIRQKVSLGMKLVTLTSKGEDQKWELEKMSDLEGENLLNAHPGQLVRIPFACWHEAGQIIIRGNVQ